MFAWSLPFEQSTCIFHHHRLPHTHLNEHQRSRCQKGVLQHVPWQMQSPCVHKPGTAHFANRSRQETFFAFASGRPRPSSPPFAFQTCLPRMQKWPDRSQWRMEKVCFDDCIPWEHRVRLARCGRWVLRYVQRAPAFPLSIWMRKGIYHRIELLLTKSCGPSFKEIIKKKKKKNVRARWVLGSGNIYHLKAIEWLVCTTLDLFFFFFLIPSSLHDVFVFFFLRSWSAHKYVTSIRTREKINIAIFFFKYSLMTKTRIS